MFHSPNPYDNISISIICEFTLAKELDAQRALKLRAIELVYSKIERIRMFGLKGTMFKS